MTFTSLPIAPDLIRRMRINNRPSRSVLSFVRAHLNRAFDKIKTRSSACLPFVARTPAAPVQFAGENRFHVAVARIARNEEFTARLTAEAPNGFFRGRPMITDQTRICGGIFVSADPHEAIVVDYKDPELRTIYDLLRHRVDRLPSAAASQPLLVFEEAVRITRQTLRYSEERVASLNIRLRLTADSKVSLGVFIKHHLGVARHRVLLVGYLIERLIDDGVIPGRVWIESALLEGDVHEKLLYFVPSGDILRFDPLAALGTTVLH